jgi:antitoxin (DNA-binding transcriptional repressor) of toxin-antitoxin stability system
MSGGGFLPARDFGHGLLAGTRCNYPYHDLGRSPVRGTPSPVLRGEDRGTAWYADLMTSAHDRPTDVSVRQFVADSGSVTRGLRQGRAYTLTLNGEPLARMIPIMRRRAVPKAEALAVFATSPAIDVGELRADLDIAVAQDLRDPYEGTGQ